MKALYLNRYQAGSSDLRMLTSNGHTPVTAGVTDHGQVYREWSVIANIEARDPSYEHPACRFILLLVTGHQMNKSGLDFDFFTECVKIQCTFFKMGNMREDSDLYTHTHTHTHTHAHTQTHTAYRDIYPSIGP